MKVAAIQFLPVFGRKQENLQRLAMLVHGAALGGAKLIVLPELATTGYSFMSKESASLVAEEVAPGNTTFDVMAALASLHGAHIVYGLVERESAGKLHNTQVYMPPTKVPTKYAKINRWANDFLWADPGRANPPIVDVEGLRVGLLVCRDVRNKVNDKWKDFYSAGDADVVCLSSNWGKGGFPSTSWMSFVEDNKTALIVSNRYGTEENNDFGGGGACIITRDGKVQCEGLVWGQDCIIYGDV